MESIKWRDLRVGDIVKVKKDEFFPADLIMLNSSDVKGRAFVETKNLDGETNLKNKHINENLKHVKKMIKNDRNIIQDNFENSYLHFLRNSNLQMFYEEPTNLLYVYKGYLQVRNAKASENIYEDQDIKTIEDLSRQHSDNVIQKESKINQQIDLSKKSNLEEKNLLLRGSILRNTEFVYGVVVYCGHDTKIMMNSVKAKPKRSKLEEQLNVYIVMIFLCLVFFCSLGSFLNILWVNNFAESSKYMFLDKKSSIVRFFLRLGNWILIFGNLVPISLMVSLEGVKFVQAIIISKDKKLLTLKDKVYCEVQSSNLNEELGQIDFIFSDKTGTLTCNEMVFRKLVIHSNPYGININQENIIDIKDQKNSAFKSLIKSGGK